jgi:hypothetical protein
VTTSSWSRSRDVGVVLCELLARQPYRTRWLVEAARTRPGISQAAVARVIERFMFDKGLIGELSSFSSRQLKDKVSRALNGGLISAPTLKLFIGAFRISQVDQHRLWMAYSDDSHALVGLSHTLDKRRDMVRPQDHRTLSVVERYVVGEDGALVGRHTLQTIRATNSAVDTYIFNHEEDATDIDVVHGGHLGQSHRYGGGLSAVEIILEEPLGHSEAAALEYRTMYSGKGEATEVRRTALAKTEHVDFAVQFSAERVPREVFWCAWNDQIGGQIVVAEPVPIRRNSARKFLPFLEQTVAGFRWIW